MLDEKRIAALKQKLLKAAGKYSDHREYETRLEAVSYTHLDVYKRQKL